MNTRGSRNYLGQTLRWVVVVLLLVTWMMPIHVASADSTIGLRRVSELLPLSDVVQIGAGDKHTCALLSNATIKCWGDNTYAQLGNNSKVASLTPVGVSGLTGTPMKLVSGKEHVCVLMVSKDVQCWGLNASGQLGTNNDLNSGIPVRVMGLNNDIVQIASAANHVCAVLTTGAVKCWGNNGYGQLGNNNRTDSGLPVDVIGLSSGVKAVTSGWTFNCALLIDGTVKCWGNNDYGQLGNNTTTGSNVPISVVGLKDKVSALAAGVVHACALLVSGAVQCWGLGSLIGSDNSTSSSVPVDISGLSSGVTAISSENSRMCALMTDGTVKCWGMGVQFPTAIGGFSDKVASITGGGLHSCALLPSHIVQCWNWNALGQLGNNSTIDSNTPVTVVMSSTVPLAVTAFMPFAQTDVTEGTQP